MEWKVFFGNFWKAGRYRLERLVPPREVPAPRSAGSGAASARPGTTPGPSRFQKLLGSPSTWVARWFSRSSSVTGATLPMRASASSRATGYSSE